MNKKMIGAAMAAIMCVGTSAQQPARLAIRMDDMGAMHSVNMAVMDVYANGISNSVEVMPVTAWYPEAVKLLRDTPGMDVGVHLAITSEWENVKWRPLTQCPSLTDDHGYFFPMSGPNPAYPGRSLNENTLDINDIEREFRAQIERALADIPQLSHISGHMGCTMLDDEVVALMQRLSDEYGLPCIDRANTSALGFTNVWYADAEGGWGGAHATLDEKVESFIRTLDMLEPGQNYLFLDHPAYDDSEMSTVYHIGYEDVATDRQGVTDMMKHPRVKQAIADRGIQLVSIRELIGR